MADDKPSGERPQFDPFKPAEPRLPGVPERKAAPKPIPSDAIVPPPAEPEEHVAPVPAWMQKLPPQLRAIPRGALYGGAGAIALLVVVLLWSAFGSRDNSAPVPVSAATSAADGPTAESASNAAQPAEPPPPVIPLPGTVATTEELSTPWASRKFIIRQAGARRPAMVVRIPVASAGSSSGYWAFLLQSAFGKCELELVTDLNRLAEVYGYESGHPMVVDPCTQTVFHPLRLDSIGPGIYARGEVVQGIAIRPPLAVEIRVEHGQIIALRTE
ncbi:MAG: hypothetical protein ACRD5W_04530 [Candidatus Acidiferrales bacterium]